MVTSYVLTDLPTTLHFACIFSDTVGSLVGGYKGLFCFEKYGIMDNEDLPPSSNLDLKHKCHGLSKEEDHVIQISCE